MPEFQEGDRVFLKPVSIHDTDYVSTTDAVLLQRLRNASYFGFSWVTNDYIDWTTECFISKPVRIMHVLRTTAYRALSYGIAPENGVPPGQSVWVIMPSALIPSSRITQSRRLTVIGKQE